MRLYVSVAGETTILTDGAPFFLEGAASISSAPVNRHEQRGPLQQGATDLGYRLTARIVTLEVHFYAATDTLLDSYRDALMDTFKPLTDTSIFLYYERDDGTTRRLTCHTVDDIDIVLVPDQKAARLHRATVKLRAANPLWLNTTVVQTAFSSTNYADWWLAGGLIGSANVMEHTESPTQGQAWTYTGTITGAWSIVARSAQETGAGTKMMFHAGTTAILALDSKDAFLGWYSTGFTFGWGHVDASGTSMPAGTNNYMGVHDGTTLRTFYNGTTNTFIASQATVNLDISGTARRWRSDRAGSASSYWSAALPKVAVFDIALSESQRIALDAAMSGTSTITTLYAVNSGDALEYPLITIRGPIQNPVLINAATGGTLNLTGLILGSADTYTVDLRDGDKAAYDQNGVNVLGSITNPISLAKWHLAPAPVATGGTNTIQVTGGSPTANTRVTVEHYNHYVSF